jgi:hypothetical protein
MHYQFPAQTKHSVSGIIQLIRWTTDISIIINA